MPNTFHDVLRRSSLGSMSVRRLAGRTPHHVASAARQGLTTTQHRAVGSENGATMATNRKTSPKAAAAASKVLRDGRTSKASKTAAASALSQRAPKKGRTKR